MAVALNSLSRFFFYYCRFSLSRHQKIKVIQYVKNLVYDRWQICKDPRQDSGQCNFANARYLGKWFTQKQCSLKSQFHIGVVQWRQRKYVPISVKHLQGCRLANFNEKNCCLLLVLHYCCRRHLRPINNFPFCIKQEQTQHFTLTC